MKIWAVRRYQWLDIGLFTFSTGAAVSQTSPSNIVGLVVKQEARAVEQADIFSRWLEKRGLSVLRHSSHPVDERAVEPDDSHTWANARCVFVLGGDGTFLSAVRWIDVQPVPVIGIKFGDVGFLAAASEEHLFDVAETILEHPFETQARMRLEVAVYHNGEKIACEPVLNDIVINKGALARLADIVTLIDGKYLTTYRADGLIIATPTGSTAYSLAAGGPVIHPTVPAILLTPICPFTLTNRPLIVPDEAAIEIRLDPKTTDIVLTCDGQRGFTVDHRHKIVVTKSPHPVNMITVPDQSYYDVLKTKLRWSGGRG
jgi:NAD+ kinase